MKKYILGGLILTLSLFILVGCSTVSNDEKNSKREFEINETAVVDDIKININSVKKIDKECFLEYGGACHSYTEPENDYFLLIDLTIENTGKEDLSISSMLSFDLKDSNGEQGKYALLTKSITSQLDGTVMPGDKLKGQIAFDVKNSDAYAFYFKDSLLSDSIKFNINSSNII